MLDIHIQGIWVQLGLVGEELQTQEGEDEGEEEEQEGEAGHILQCVAHGIKKEFESLPLPAELEDSHNPDRPESCDGTAFVNNIIIAVRVQNLRCHYVNCACQNNQGIEEVVQLALIVGLYTRCSQPDGQLRHEEQCKNYVELFYDKVCLLINGVPIQREDNRVGNNCECHELGEGWTCNYFYCESIDGTCLLSRVHASFILYYLLLLNFLVFHVLETNLDTNDLSHVSIILPMIQ